MNTMTLKGVSNHGFHCQTGVRKLLSKFESATFKIESAAQSNSVITDSEAQLGQLLVRTGLLSETALAACLSYASKLDIPLGAVLRLTDMQFHQAYNAAVLMKHGLHSRSKVSRINPIAC